MFYVPAVCLFLSFCGGIHLVEAKAAERSFLWQEVAQSWRAADVGRVGRVAFHKTGKETRKVLPEVKEVELNPSGVLH